VAAASNALTYRALGADLALTRYVGAPSSVPLEAADSWGTLDLQVAAAGQGGLSQTGDIRDAATVAGRQNLAQALLLRLLTPRGALATLGHPDYGSRLVELIGRLNNDTTRNLARLYTLEALKQEQRVKEILDLTVETVTGQPETIRIGFSVLPLNDTDPLALALEVSL
jgi:phage baseplate assembly protein W